jgi:hypothetical protein
MIAIGAVMVITSILAEVAVCSASRCLLVVCFVVYVATVIGCVVMIAWFATQRDTVKQSMGDLLATCVKDYVAAKGSLTSPCVATVDTIQSAFQCCGARSTPGVTDYGTANMVNMAWGVLSGKPADLVFPASCGSEWQAVIVKRVRPSSL